MRDGDAMLSGTLSRSIGSTPGFQSLRGPGGSSGSHAQKAARTLKPAIAIVQVLRCIAFAAVVSVVGTFTCFQPPSVGHFHGDHRGHSGSGSGPGRGGGAVLHAFLDRPVLCALVITAACALGLAFRAKPRFQKILELHSRRSLAIRATFIAAIVLLEVHALRRVGATGVALAGISFQYVVKCFFLFFFFVAWTGSFSGRDCCVALTRPAHARAFCLFAHRYLILPTLALVLLGRGNGTVPAKKLQGVLVITGAIVLLFATSHFLSSSSSSSSLGTAGGAVPHPALGHRFDSDGGAFGDASQLAATARNIGAEASATDGSAASVAAASLASSLSDVPQHASLSSSGGDTRRVQHDHHPQRGVEHQGARPSSSRDPLHEERGSLAFGDRAQQRRRARRHGRGDDVVVVDDDEHKSSGRRLLLASSDMQPAAEETVRPDDAAARERLAPRAANARIPGRQRQYVVRLLATWKGVKCTAVACVFVALAATLQVVKTSYFQLFGVKRAGALFLPMETLTTGAATVLLLPLAAWEHFRSPAAAAFATADEVVMVHGQKFVAENTVQSLWQSIWAALLLLFVGLVFAAAVVVDHAVRSMCTDSTAADCKVCTHHRF